MKLNYLQLTQHLKSQLKPVYLISGEDYFLKHEALAEITSKAQTLQFSEQTKITIEQDDDIYTGLYSNAFFSQKRLVILNFRELLPKKSAVKLLEEYLKKYDDNICLIIMCGKLDAKNNRSSWVVTTEKLGAHITIWPITTQQMPEWLKMQARKHALSLQEQAIARIIEHTEGHLFAADQVLAKLALLNMTTVTAASVEAFINQDCQYSIFDLGDCLLMRDGLRFIKILRTLAQEKTEPTLVLWVIMRELRQALNIAELLQEGRAFTEICQSLRVFPKRAPLYRNFLAKMSLAACKTALQRASELDRIVKGDGQGAPWKAFEVFALTLETS